MDIPLTWADIALRLACGFAAGVLLGFDREEQGRVAGLRTMILVTLAATAVMIETNLLMASAGPAPGFLRMDPLRLPLGVLSGIGFIGAGAIVRRSDRVWGVTTAATLWIATVIGLIFGAGFYALGAVVSALSVGVVWGLRYLEARMSRVRHAGLRLTTRRGGLTISQLEAELAAAGLVASAWSEEFAGGECRIACRLQWREGRAQAGPRELVERLADHEDVVSVGCTRA